MMERQTLVVLTIALPPAADIAARSGVTVSAEM